jgi:hypothetical protein
MTDRLEAAIKNSLRSLRVRGMIYKYVIASILLQAYRQVNLVLARTTISYQYRRKGGKDLRILKATSARL